MAMTRALTGSLFLRLKIAKGIFLASVVAPITFTPQLTEPNFRYPFQAARTEAIVAVPISFLEPNETLDVLFPQTVFRESASLFEGRLAKGVQKNKKVGISEPEMLDIFTTIGSISLP